jgi:hypothetical protein
MAAAASTKIKGELAGCARQRIIPPAGRVYSFDRKDGGGFESFPGFRKDWLDLTPLERFRRSEELFAPYLAMGGSLDPDPDPTTPFDSPVVELAARFSAGGRKFTVTFSPFSGGNNVARQSTRGGRQGRPGRDRSAQIAITENLQPRGSNAELPQKGTK